MPLFKKKWTCQKAGKHFTNNLHTSYFGMIESYILKCYAYFVNN